MHVHEFGFIYHHLKRNRHTHTVPKCAPFTGPLTMVHLYGRMATQCDEKEIAQDHGK